MKIIHCSDVHLGSKIEAKLKDISSQKKQMVRNAFFNMVEYAKDNEIEVILLSGDVFDSDKPFKKDKSFFYDIIMSNPNIKFYYLRGNHDKEEVNEQEISNLYTFKDKWTKYELDNICISGIEMTKQNATSLYSSLRLDEDKINIVLLHGQESDSVGLDLIKVSNLKDKNIDYLALGHVHRYSKKVLDKRGIYCYAGCLEGRGFDETGDKGFIVLDVEDKITHKFIPFSKNVIEEVKVNISKCMGLSDILSTCKEYITNKNYIYRVVLTGDILPELEFEESDVSSYLSNYCLFVVCKNNTSRKINYNDYKKDLSLRGEFVRTISKHEDLSEEEKKDVISLGLRLLLGKEVEL